MKIALAGLLGLAAVTAYADPVQQLASLASVDGKIMVNKGHGFVSAKPGMPLIDGDRIIALEGSRAAVVYPDGCVTQIKENSLLALEKGAGCNKEPIRTGGTREPLRYAQAIGGTANDSNRENRAPVLPVGGTGGVPPVIGFGGAGPMLLLGGLMTGGMLFDMNRHNTSVSPH